MWEWVARSNVQQISYIPIGIRFFLLLVQAEDLILCGMNPANTRGVNFLEETVF